MSNYCSPSRERLAKKIMYLRGQGFSRQECIIDLERDGYPDEHVLVDSIFDRPMSDATKKRANAQSGQGE
jgi:hypothetical protein